MNGDFDVVTHQPPRKQAYEGAGEWPDEPAKKPQPQPEKKEPLPPIRPPYATD